MRQVDKISLKELEQMAQKMYGELVKADVDVVKKIVVVDMGMHADGEAELLKKGSRQEDLWGINLHPKDYGTDDFIEFDSLINIRPSQGNPSRDILDEKVKRKIIAIISEVVHG